MTRGRHRKTGVRAKYGHDGCRARDACSREEREDTGRDEGLKLLGKGFVIESCGCCSWKVGGDGGCRW